MTKCVICNHRPARTEKGYCANCEAHVQKEAQGGTGMHRDTVAKYLVYRGNVVGLVPSGNGTLKSVPVRANPERLPKSKVINLDYYCEGYDRKTIKRFKAAVLQAYPI